MRKSTLHRITIVVVAVGLSQRLREADDRIVNDERRSGRAHWTRKEARSQTAAESVNNAYLAAKNPWLQRQFRASLRLGDLPFVVGRGPVAWEGLPPLRPDLKLDDTVPFRLSRNHFMIGKRDGNYYVRDLRSTLGTIVNGEPIGNHCRSAPLRAGENEGHFEK
jgi:CRP/FNR family transcriptional regulator, cyclic AMP receptor protein